jgi:hypothetical protein
MAPITVPSSNHTVDVHIIDTTFRLINGRPAAFMSPAINGFDTMNALAYSFLITTKENGKERKFLFDLGAPKDWKNDLPPSVTQSVVKWEKAGIDIKVEKYLSEILEESGIPLEDIEALIWRYERPFCMNLADNVVILIGIILVNRLYFHQQRNS